MSNDPTGAARTAEQQEVARELAALELYCKPPTECPSAGPEYAARREGWIAALNAVAAVMPLRVKSAREAERSHLAGQAGPEVETLLDKMWTTAYEEGRQGPAFATSRERRASDEAMDAVKAAYAALRQQRDEAVRDRNYWRSTAAGERAEAATERQRAERAEAANERAVAGYERMRARLLELGEDDDAD